MHGLGKVKPQITGPGVGVTVEVDTAGDGVAVVFGAPGLDLGEGGEFGG